MTTGKNIGNLKFQQELYLGNRRDKMSKRDCGKCSIKAPDTCKLCDYFKKNKIKRS